VALISGTKLGPYEIMSPLGAGGMGEVYRARDSRLHREVAVKVLPEFFASDPDRLRRFEQESRAAAALNHPNILVVHDSGSHEGVPYLVFELLLGETLRESLSRGPTPVRKGIETGVQIARGLAAAHEKGIVHRDLKPENLFIVKGGQIKILDFGLAKVVPENTSVASQLRTVSHGDHSGFVGTVGYISPEQVRGHAADRRSDIFAFGAVMYEMLTGTRTFNKQTPAETMTAILKEDPTPISQLAPATSPALQRVVQRCLEKDPAQRFQSASDLAFALQELSDSAVSNTSAQQAATPRRHWISAALGVSLALLAVTFLMVLWRSPKRKGKVVVTPFTSFPGREVSPAFSPDGTHVVFAWNGDPSHGHEGFDLYVKEIGSEHLLRLTNRASDWLVPAWSPDGRFVYFSRAAGADSGIYIIPALGGEERRLKDVGFYTDAYNSLTLSADGLYLSYSDVNAETGLSHVAILELQSMRPVTIALPDCVISGDPAFAPSGHKLAFACTPSWGFTDIYVMRDIGEASRRVTQLFGFPTGITWSTDGKSIIVGAIRGQADLWRIEESTGSVEALLFGTDANSPTVSSRGNMLAFARETESSNIWRIDLSNQGKSAERFIASTRFEQNPKYSPDGKYVLFESSRSGFSEIWMSHSDGTEVQQLTHFAGPLTGSPSWAPDSRRFVFDSRAGGRANIYVMDRDERVARIVGTDTAENHAPGWSTDGQWIYYSTSMDKKPGIYQVSPQGGKAGLLTSGEADTLEVSPDGKNLYYSVGFRQMRIHRLSLATGTNTLLPQSVTADTVAWTVATTGIYFLRQDTRDNASVHYYSFSDGSTRMAASLPANKRLTPFIGGLSLSPDEKWLLYSQIDEQQSDITLIENFQ
jgi:serine/threonine protein kinase/sugar lactone lactonase YvrE